MKIKKILRASHLRTYFKNLTELNNKLGLVPFSPFCLIPSYNQILSIIMEKGLPFDTAAIKAAYNAQDIETHDKYGVGELYQFGQTKVEVYQGLGETTPIVRIRAPGGLMAYSHVVNVQAGRDGGMLIDCAVPGQIPHCSVNVSQNGEVAILFSPAPARMQISENGTTRKIKGREYSQSTIDIAGTLEGLRVQIKGKVDAAPRLVNTKDQRSDLTFFLIEENPLEPDKPIYHEVRAANKAKQELKEKKLVKDSVIEAVFYRHRYVIDTVGGDQQTIDIDKLHTIIYVEGRRTRSAKRQKIEQS